MEQIHADRLEYFKMATPTDDASTTTGATTTTDMGAKFADLKTQFAAEEGGVKPQVQEEEDEHVEDEGAEADDATTDTEGTDGADEEIDTSEDDDEAGDDKDKQASEYRFTQFKGDGSEATYRKNLEDAYLNSSTEALKWKEKAESAEVFERQVNAVKAAAQKDPEFGEKLLGLLKQGAGAAGEDGQFDDSKVSQTSDNPFLVNAETEWNQKNDESIKKFAENNPEVLTDPKINNEVKRWIKHITDAVYEDEKRLITTGEAMERAYKMLGYEVKNAEKQDLVNGMKQNAAPTRPQAPKKKPSAKGGQTKQFSDLTLDFASKMGISKDRLAKGSKR